LGAGKFEQLKVAAMQGIEVTAGDGDAHGGASEGIGGRQADWHSLKCMQKVGLLGQATARGGVGRRTGGKDRLSAE
jgi:hypothetical protein